MVTASKRLTDVLEKTLLRCMEASRFKDVLKMFLVTYSFPFTHVLETKPSQMLKKYQVSNTFC